MSFPVYTIRLERNTPVPYGRRSRSRRDPADDPPRRARSSKVCTLTRVPLFRVVLRRDRTIRVPEVTVDNPNRAASVAHALVGDSPYEKLLAILLDGQARVAGAIIIATTSSISSAATSVRGVFAGAIAHNASAIILAHNHPSGSTEPSEDDRRFLRKAKEAADILGIPIVDSLIVTRDRDRWSSFC